MCIMYRAIGVSSFIDSGLGLVYLWLVLALLNSGNKFIIAKLTCHWFPEKVELQCAVWPL